MLFLAQHVVLPFLIIVTSTAFFMAKELFRSRDFEKCSEFKMKFTSHFSNVLEPSTYKIYLIEIKIIILLTIVSHNKLTKNNLQSVIRDFVTVIILSILSSND